MLMSTHASSIQYILHTSIIHITVHKWSYTQSMNKNGIPVGSQTSNI
jgi:tRNA(Phe) wybutosine-synthesizing methylase Tyw3